MQRKVIVGAVATAVVALATILVVRESSGQPGGKAETKKSAVEGTVNASGTGVVKVTADTAHVPMTVNATGKDHAAALESLNKQKEKLVTALKKQGFDKIHVGYIASPSSNQMGMGMGGMMGGMPGTTFVNAGNAAPPSVTGGAGGMGAMGGAGGGAAAPKPGVSPVSLISSVAPGQTAQDGMIGMVGMVGMAGIQPNPKVPEVKPMTVLAVSVTVVVQKEDDFPGLIKSINAIRNVAAENGVANSGLNLMSNPMYGYSGSNGVVLSHSKEQEARMGARVAALQDAEQSARRLAQEAGIKLREIIAVSEPSASASSMPHANVQLGMGMGMGSTAFDPVTGQKEISMTVSVTYRH